MAAKVTVGGKLPGDDRNGLGAFYADLLKDPTKRRVLIAIVDVGSVKTDYDDGDAIESPQVRFRRVEFVTDQDMQAAHRLLQRGWEDRSGTPTLPLELEDDVKAVFAGITIDDDGKMTAAPDPAPPTPTDGGITDPFDDNDPFSGVDE